MKDAKNKMITIRQATPDDADLIHQLAWQIFPETYKDILTPEQRDFMMDWMYSVPNLIKQMTEEKHTYLLGYEEDKCIGYVSVQPEGNAIYHLQKLYILPEKQGLGYGRILFKNAIAYIKKISPQTQLLHLNVNRYNKALDFYKHIGMKIIASGDFPIGNGYYMNDYIMELDLMNTDMK